MKTILEVTPTKQTLYEMPDWVYDMFIKTVELAVSFNHTRKPTLQRTLGMLPSEVRALITMKDVTKEPDQKPMGDASSCF